MTARRSVLVDDDQPLPKSRRDSGTGKSSSISSVSWRPTAQLEFQTWVTEGRRIGAMARSSPWWLGDWLVYGTAKWGERYSLAARVTSYDVKTLRNIRYVAARVPTSLRRDELSWSHHALLAAFETPEQRHWLERACADKLSVEDLRIELRSMQRGRYSRSGERLDSTSEADQIEFVECPQCGSQVPLPVAPLT